MAQHQTHKTLQLGGLDPYSLISMSLPPPLHGAENTGVATDDVVVASDAGSAGGDEAALERLTKACSLLAFWSTMPKLLTESGEPSVLGLSP